MIDQTNTVNWNISLGEAKARVGANRRKDEGDAATIACLFRSNNQSAAYSATMMKCPPRSANSMQLSWERVLQA